MEKVDKKNLHKSDFFDIFITFLADAHANVHKIKEESDKSGFYEIDFKINGVEVSFENIMENYSTRIKNMREHIEETVNKKAYLLAKEKLNLEELTSKICDITTDIDYKLRNLFDLKEHDFE